MHNPTFVIPALAAGISPGHTFWLVGSRFPAELGMTNMELRAGLLWERELPTGEGVPLG